MLAPFGRSLAQSQLRTAAFLTGNIARRHPGAFAVTLTQGDRFYAAGPSMQQRVVYNDFGVLNAFVPVTQTPKPSLFSKVGLKYRLKQVTCFARTSMSMASLKWKMGRKFQVEQFKKETAALYEVMNEAFASGDRSLLQHLCSPVLVAKLKADIKRRKVTLKWKSHGEVESPRIVSVTNANLSENDSVTQVVMRLHTKQSMAVYNDKGVCISNNEKNPVDVIENIVFQTQFGKVDYWIIYGKLEETSPEVFK